MKKKKKHHKIIYYLTIWIVIFIFIAISASIITLQTSFGKEKIKKAMINFATKNGIDLKFDKIDGILPFQYLLNNVSIETQNTKFDIEELSFRIKFLPLLKKNLSFKNFQARNIRVEKQTSINNQDISNIKNEKTNVDSQIDNIFLVSLPIKINFDSIKLKDLHLKIDGTFVSLDISGRAKLLKFAKALTLQLNIQRKDFKKSYLDISFKAYKKDKFFKTKANLYVATSKVLSPFYQNDRDFSFNLNVDSTGNFKSFKNIKNQIFSKIDGKTNGHIFKVDNIPSFLDLESNFSFDFSMLSDSSINISKGFLKNDFFEIYLDALIDNNFNIQKTNLTLRVDELKKINEDLFGSFLSKTSYENKKLETYFDFKDFSISDVSFVDFKGSLIGAYLNETLQAKLISNAFTLNETFNISSDLKFEKFDLNISNLNIASPSIKLLANFDLNSSFNLVGQGNINFNDLAPIEILYPKKLFNATIDANFKFNEKTENDQKFQNIDLNITAQNYFFETLYGNSAKIYLSIDKPFSKPEMDIRSTFKDLKYHDLKISEINFSTSTKQENWPYELKLIANLKKPIELESQGFFRIYENDFTLNIQDLKGTLFSDSFISPKPILITAKKDTFQISDLDIEFANSSILADIDFTSSSSKAKVTLKNFPLDFLSINPLDLDVTGSVDLNFEIEKKLAANGLLDIDVKKLEILALGDEKPLTATGSLKSKIQNDYFNLDSSLKLKNTQLISLNGKIPINLDLAALKVNINDQKKLSLDVSYNGKIEELLDFINVGPQRLEGDLKTDLHLTNTLKDLKMSGLCTFENGYFENYYTGTILKDISAQMKAVDEKVTLEYLKGKDPENGKIEAEGVFSLSQKKDFPFFFKAQLDNLLCVDSNMIRSKATASIEISGDRTSSTAKGNVKANYLDMTIPDKLPIVIPDLKATFISHPSKNHDKYIVKPKMYPIHLNFDLDATNPIRIHGQGLDSTWIGNFKIGGTYMSFETIGDLKLLKGSYVFSGRHFDLTKGKVSFTGKPNEMPILDIQATINQRGVKIIADVEGPLDSPKITFSSSPPLPSSSIMALLIFGQQLSELTESQTIELASTMSQELDDSSLSSSNALANLGIDRFNIIKPSATDPTTSDQMAVQFGKYLTKGIVVSLSQGAEQGSSNIIVEIDLKKGFIFQAETQQQEEQGKFSLKWRRNY